MCLCCYYRNDKHIIKIIKINPLWPIRTENSTVLWYTSKNKTSNPANVRHKRKKQNPGLHWLSTHFSLRGVSQTKGCDEYRVWRVHSSSLHRQNTSIQTSNKCDLSCYWTTVMGWKGKECSWLGRTPNTVDSGRVLIRFLVQNSGDVEITAVLQPFVPVQINLFFKNPRWFVWGRNPPIRKRGMSCELYLLRLLQSCHSNLVAAIFHHCNKINN